jgi:cobalt/nickel transport protein
MKKLHIASMTAAFAVALAGNAFAHFGMVIPSTNIVKKDNNIDMLELDSLDKLDSPQKKNVVTLDLSFSHPFEMKGMDLKGLNSKGEESNDPPKFYVISSRGKKTDLQPSLKESTVMGHKAYRDEVEIKRPGVYTFVMEPNAYFEPAEEVYIIHYTKTIIAAFGDDQGWDQPVGIATEIVPLTRPFGNYAGNSFSGKVLMDGEPVPNAEVEVELYNKDSQFTAPSDYHVTQVVKADENGVFTFTCPQPGWWGFAALNKAEYTIKDKKVELGAVLWVYFDEYQKVYNDI